MDLILRLPGFTSHRVGTWGRDVGWARKKQLKFKLEKMSVRGSDSKYLKNSHGGRDSSHVLGNSREHTWGQQICRSGLHLNQYNLWGWWHPSQMFQRRVPLTGTAVAPHSWGCKFPLTCLVCFFKTALLSPPRPFLPTSSLSPEFLIPNPAMVSTTYISCLPGVWDRGKKKRLERHCPGSLKTLLQC